MKAGENTATVAAISTPHGRGGVAMIRISGEETPKVLGKMFVPSGKTAPTDAPRKMIYGNIVDGGEIIDTGLAVYFEDGSSFTGESSAEIYCHGGVLVSSRVLGAAFSAGAKPAGAGDFTRRAFLNGKLSLTEAESIGLLIDADTDTEMKLASAGTRGVTSAKIDKIASSVSEVLSALFAVIDYPDEDIDEVEAQRIYSILINAAAECQKLADTFRFGKAVCEGVKTLICGKTNVGKSSLYNVLLGEERAIVTDIPCTTRDVLEDRVDVGGVTLTLWDTAGIRQTDDEVERIGVERAAEKLDAAELVIAVFDGSRPLQDGDKQIISDIEEKNKKAAKIATVNKADCGMNMSAADVELLGSVFSKTVFASAKTAEGLDGLKMAVGELFDADKIDVSNDAVIWDENRRSELLSAKELLESAATALIAGEPEDAVLSEAELALSALRRTDGRGISEEIVSGIFARFCVGK